MLTEKDIIFDYQNFLLSADRKVEPSKKRKKSADDEEITNRKTRSFSAILQGSPKEMEMQVKTIFSYIVDLTGWSPDTVLKNFTPDVCRLFGLDYVFSRAGLVLDLDLPRIAAMAFPGEIPYNFNDTTLTIYKKAARLEEYKNANTLQRVPKNFFMGTDGLRRAVIVMRYITSRYFGDMTIPERFNFFANTKRAREFLNEYQLGALLKAIDNDPLELFYITLPFKIKEAYAFCYHNIKIGRYFTSVLQKKQRANAQPEGTQ